MIYASDCAFWEQDYLLMKSNLMVAVSSSFYVPPSPVFSFFLFFFFPHLGAVTAREGNTVKT